MSKLLHQILLFLLCGALVFMVFFLPQRSSKPDVRINADALPQQKTAGTQLLWESLSRQFVSVKPY